MTSTKRRVRQKQYHHGDLRRSLLDGALSLIELEGVAALSLREVARRIGVSHAAPHHHFENKTLLLCAVAEEGFRALNAEMVAAVGLVSSEPAERLHAIGVAYVRFAAAHPAHFRVMFSAEVSGRQSTHSLREASAATFAQLTSGLLAAGLTEEAARDAALMAWSAVHGLAMLWIEGQLALPGVASNVEALARKVVAGLSRRAP